MGNIIGINTLDDYFSTSLVHLYLYKINYFLTRNFTFLSPTFLLNCPDFLFTNFIVKKHPIAEPIE